MSGILTQGDPDNMTWVSEFGVWYSSNCETFTPVRDSDGKMEVGIARLAESGKQ